MTSTAAREEILPLAGRPAPETTRALLSQLLWLSLPVMAEQVLHMLVGLTDTYLANHLPADAASATAAVGTISYVLWLVGLVVSAVGTGSTAIIARARGARHRSLANSVAGQSFSSALLLGAAAGLAMYAWAGPMVRLARLSPAAQAFALSYLRMLSVAMPFTTVMFVANACQRGAGDTLTPALSMIVVDAVNMAFTFGLCRGYWGLPKMGFDGIALGTVIAYVAGGAIQTAVLFGGWSAQGLARRMLSPFRALIRDRFPRTGPGTARLPREVADLYVQQGEPGRPRPGLTAASVCGAGRTLEPTGSPGVPDAIPYFRPRRRENLRLYPHRLRPHWATLRRILRIGLPAGSEGLVTWGAQFIIVILINRMDPTSVMPAAHINAVRIESLSFLSGFAFATAAATLVGQSLGMRDPDRARRCAYLSYAVGGGIMTLIGLAFVFFGSVPAAWLSGDPAIAALTARCLRITGFIQSGFAASMIFSGALRGAGDTVAVMAVNLASILLVRFAGVLVVGLWLGYGLAAIWVVLACELFLRGLLIYGRFAGGRWKEAKV